MKTNRLIVGLLSGAALVASAMAAHADTQWLVNYTSTGGIPVSGTFDFTVSDTLNGFGAHDITGLVSGSVDGDLLIGLALNPAQPNETTALGFNYDNNFFDTPAHFSNNGALFQGASGSLYNLYASVPAGLAVVNGAANSTMELIRTTPNGNLTSIGSITAGTVPEPASWALMILGIGGMGARLRSNRRRLATGNAITDQVMTAA
jgi:hypothetical protein